MTRVFELAGQRFGSWIVVSRDHTGAHKAGTQAMWLCKCDCGADGVVASWRLRAGWSKSCGCWRKNQRKLPSGVSSSRGLYKVLKRNASVRGLTVEIMFDEFLNMSKMNCSYCGAEPSAEYRVSRWSNGGYVYNGIDRVDNSIGYVTGNVVPCCWGCNLMKGQMLVSEFIARCQRIAEYVDSRSKVEQYGVANTDPREVTQNGLGDSSIQDRADCSRATDPWLGGSGDPRGRGIPLADAVG